MVMAQPVMSLPQDPQSPRPLSREKNLLGDPASVRKGEVSSCFPQTVSSSLMPGPDVCVMEGCVCVCVCVCARWRWVCEMEGCVGVGWRGVCVCVCVMEVGV